MGIKEHEIGLPKQQPVYKVEMKAISPKYDPSRKALGPTSPCEFRSRSVIIESMKDKANAETDRQILFIPNAPTKI